MTKASDKQEAETLRRFEAALRRALATPPGQPIEVRKRKKKAKKKRAQ